MATRRMREWTPSPRIRHALGDALVITAPEWFERADFQEYRKNPEVATWQNEDLGYQDTFTVYVDGELRDKGFLPPDIERSIMKLVDMYFKDTGYHVIWIKAV